MAGVADDESEVLEVEKDEQDCIDLTEDLYVCISELGRDPRYVGIMYAQELSFPPWGALTKGRGEKFEWMVYSGYLGLLKAGLKEKSVAGWNGFYQRIVSIWERLVRSAIEADPYKKSPFVLYSYDTPPQFRVKLVFSHIDRGRFQVSLHSISKNKPWMRNTRMDAAKEVKGVASQAFLVNHSEITSKRKPQTAPFTAPIKHLPGCEEIDQEKDLLRTEGYLSMGYHRELLKTIAYVAQYMEEEEGETVDWEKLRRHDPRRTATLSKIFGEALSRCIEEHGSSMLGFKGKRKARSGLMKGVKRPRKVDLTPEFISDTESVC